MSQIKSYFPTIYQDIKEINELCNAEQPVIDDLNSELKLSYNRGYVATSDETGVKLYEKLLNIQADSINEDLDFRKQRIISRLSIAPPYTMQYLRQQLDFIIGKDKYKIYCDYNNYTLYIEAITSSKNWFLELKYLMARIKPANILYIYTSYDTLSIKLQQKIGYNFAKWRYQLGNWNLGQYPFLSLDVEDTDNYILGSWKLGEKQFTTIYTKDLAMGGITQDFLRLSANNAKDIISKVVINNSLEISKEDFYSFSVDNNLVTILFLLPEQTDITEIYNIKVVSQDNTTLTDRDVYIQVGENLRIRIDIEFKEETNE